MKRALFSLGLLLAVSHCGSADTTSASSIPDGTSDASPPLPPPGNYGDGGVVVAEAGRPSPTNDGGCGSVDLPDDAGADANCDGADGIIGVDVYVSVDSGSDTNVGNPAAPLRTLAAALTLATSRHGAVLVKQGTYPGDVLDAAGMWSIYGGYSDGFIGAPKRELTILSASSVGLLLDKAESVTLAHLTIQGAEPSDPKQPSAHALRTRVTKLVLDDVVVDAGDGVSMRPGAQGIPGANGVNGASLACDGVLQPAYVLGANSAHGASGEGKPQGDLTKKLRAAQGTNGTPGSDGADAPGALSIAGDLLVGDVGARGNNDGKAGFGAAAGGNSTNWPPYGVVYGGVGGSGGCPGHGGSGGASGGSTVAILALAGTVDVRRSQIETGIAGTGGDGGPGGTGGAGGTGGSPTDASGAIAPGIVCQPSNDPMQVNCAGFGGVGGTGGAGGNGGGGAGGWTLGLLTIGAATGTIDAATNTSLGPPGDGGKGNGGGRAPNGKRAQTLHIN